MDERSFVQPNELLIGSDAFVRNQSGVRVARNVCFFWSEGNMRIAFDARCFSKPPHSFRRVLQNLFDAALAMGWDVELWMDQGLHPELERYRDWVVPAGGKPGRNGAQLLWSPSLDAVRTSLPVVATIHDINPLLPDNRPWLVRLWRGARFRYRAGRLFQRAARISTDSEYSRLRIAEEFPASADKLHVVPLFVDAGLKRVEPAVMNKILSSFGLSDAYVLFVGSLRRHKNWHGLMKAFANLPPVLRSRHHLVLCGPVHRDRANADRLAASLGITEQVHILGTVSDEALMALYSGAGLFAFPSFLEGFGLPPLEAMSYGVPVVATDCTCVPEVLGDAPVYVSPHDLDSLAGAMRSVLEDGILRARLVEAGIHRVREFNSGRTGAAMKSVIDGILPGK